MTYSIKKYIAFVILCGFCTATCLFGQEENAISPDSSLRQGNIRGTEIEEPVSYEAQTIEMTDDHVIILSGRAKVTYQDMILTAGRITLDWDNHTMTAESVPDTVWSKDDTSTDSVQVVKQTGIPEFSQAGDVMSGDVMVYNYQTRKGRVLRGRTVYEEGFYSGEFIKMVKANSLNVSNANFTTCDQENEPHFHFWSKEMKIEVNNKVVAKPLIMYIGHVPVVALPFIYFPIRRGRHSGILVPRYGESTYEGRYLRGLGYYLAISDYWDVKGMVDYFEKSGFLFRGNLNYGIRYKLKGNFSGSWTKKDFEISGQQERRWDLVFNHSQEISQTTQLSIYGQFVSSSSFYRDLSYNREHRLRQEIRSNATLTKRLSGSTSITVNLSQVRKIDTEEIFETLPQISFRVGQFALFPKSKAKKGEQIDNRWYHSLYVSYSSRFLLKKDKVREMMAVDTVFVVEQRAGWDHSLRFSSSQQLFGWLTITPSINYEESWFDKRKEYSFDPESDGDDQIKSSEMNGFFTRRTFDVATSFNTKIYGVFQSRFLNNVTLRHVASPSIGFVYQPDFSQKKYGYYQTVEDTSGHVIETYDRYQRSLFGSTPKGGRKAIVFSLQNLFQMKLGEGESAKKLDLFTWNLSSSYNWKTEQFRLDDLTSSFRASPVQDVSVDVQSTYSFYKNNEQGVRINQLYLNDATWKNFLKKKWLQLTSIAVNLNLRLKGRVGNTTSEENEFDTTILDPVGNLEGLQNLPGDRFDTDETISALDIPWDLSATVSYRENRYNPLKPVKKWWARTNLNFSLTPNWKISYSAQLNLMKKEIMSQDFVIYRDLHCWEAYFAWTPTGYNKRFYFKINIKASMLQEIKFEKGSGQRGLYGD